MYKTRFLCFALLTSVLTLEAAVQDWDAQHIHDCEQIISSTQFHSDYGPWVVVVGGCSPTDENYKKAQHAGLLLAMNGYSVVTGSGPGIMEAANSGTVLAGGISLGFILKGEDLNEYIPEGNYLQVSHISHRLEGMIGNSSGCIAFPGGLGTLDEVVFALDNFRYQAVPRPVVLVGFRFWGTLVEWMKNLHYTHTCPQNLYLVDSEEEAVEIIFSHYRSQPCSLISN